MELKEAVKETIRGCHVASMGLNKGLVLIEVEKKNAPVIESTNYEPMREIEVKLVILDDAIEYMKRWEQGEIEFAGINFNMTTGPRVRYLVKESNSA